MKINIKDISGISRSQKILLSLFKLASGTQKQVRFEDIAVEAFLNFPSDFQLKGYPEYPDTGDIIHKPLYSELKKAGYVLSGNKFFSLTPKGIAYSNNIFGKSVEAGKTAVSLHDKFSAVQQKELERIKNSTAYHLYSQNKKEDILDIDFYAYLGVTVRTDKSDFLGRMKTVEDAISSVEDKSGELYKILNGLHKYLKEKFENNINYVLDMKGGKR
jgi:hypothetical protein